MKSYKRLFVILALVVSAPAFAGDMFNIFDKTEIAPAVEPATPEIRQPAEIPGPMFLFQDPTHEVVMKQLMDLVAKDLQLCLTSLEGKGKSYLNAFPALGHLNHACCALGKVNPPKPFKKVIWEIAKRINCAKFYVLMYSFDEAKTRVQSLIEYLGTLG